MVAMGGWGCDRLDSGIPIHILSVVNFFQSISQPHQQLGLGILSGANIKFI